MLLRQEKERGKKSIPKDAIKFWAYPSLVNARFTVMASNVVELVMGLLVVRREGDGLWDKVLLGSRIFARFDGDGGCERGMHLILLFVVFGCWLRRGVCDWRCDILGEDEVIEIHGFWVVHVLF